MRRQLHLNAFLMNTGHHEASWRLPESDPHAHVDLAHYVDHVVPILRTRGLLRTEYGPRQTLRERYGLPRPANQYVSSAPAPALV